MNTILVVLTIAGVMALVNLITGQAGPATATDKTKPLGAPAGVGVPLPGSGRSSGTQVFS